MHLLVDKIDKLYDSPQPYLQMLYKAILVTSYFGLFRIGEVTYGPHVIKAKDIHIGINKQKILIVLYSSKTHSSGTKPQLVKILEFDKPDQDRANLNMPSKLCPFSALRSYMDI